MYAFRRTKFNNSTFFNLKKYQNNLVNISKYATFSIDNPKDVCKHSKFKLEFDPNVPNENEETQSILLDPQGPYAKLPTYKRAPAPKIIDLKSLTQLETNVFINPYGRILTLKFICFIGTKISP